VAAGQHDFCNRIGAGEPNAERCGHAFYDVVEMFSFIEFVGATARADFFSPAEFGAAETGNFNFRLGRNSAISDYFGYRYHSHPTAELSRKKNQKNCSRHSFVHSFKSLHFGD